MGKEIEMSFKKVAPLPKPKHSRKPLPKPLPKPKKGPKKPPRRPIEG